MLFFLCPERPPSLARGRKQNYNTSKERSTGTSLSTIRQRHILRRWGGLSSFARCCWFSFLSGQYCSEHPRSARRKPHHLKGFSKSSCISISIHFNILVDLRGSIPSFSASTHAIMVRHTLHFRSHLAVGRPGRRLFKKTPTTSTRSAHTASCSLRVSPLPCPAWMRRPASLCTPGIFEMHEHSKSNARAFLVQLHAGGPDALPDAQ